MSCCLSGLPRPPRDIKSGLKRTKKKLHYWLRGELFFVVFCAFAVYSSGVVVAAGLVFELCCACLWGDFLMITDIKAAAAAAEAAMMVALGNRSSERERSGKNGSNAGLKSALGFSGCCGRTLVWHR